MAPLRSAALKRYIVTAFLILILISWFAGRAFTSPSRSLSEGWSIHCCWLTKYRSRSDAGPRLHLGTAPPSHSLLSRRSVTKEDGEGGTSGSISHFLL